MTELFMLPPAAAVIFMLLFTAQFARAQDVFIANSAAMAGKACSSQTCDQLNLAPTQGTASSATESSSNEASVSFAQAANDTRPDDIQSTASGQTAVGGTAPSANDGDDKGCNDDDGCPASDVKAGDQSAQDASGEDDDTHPGVQLQRSHYSDSDHNSVESETMTATEAIGDVLASYRLDSAEASDRDGVARYTAGSLLLHRNISEELAFDMALGSVRTVAGDSLIGSVDGALNRDDLSITAQISRNTLDTVLAQAIRLNQRQTDFSIDASDSIVENLTADLEVHHLLYTDGNRANQLGLTSKYVLAGAPGELSIGYQLSYAAYAMNANDGYWSPQLLLSHEALLQWAYNWAEFYGKLELAGGYQIVEMAPNHGSTANNYGGGSGYDVSATGTIGIRPSPNTRIEYSFSSEHSTGWSSTLSGMNFRFNF